MAAQKVIQAFASIDGMLTALLLLAVGFLLGYWQRRVVDTHNFQNSGEELVARTLQRHFKASDYHLLNHITLKHRGGTTQVDHILVSRYGVFVIETKDYTGWIFANAEHDTWTQVTFTDKFKFQNPIHQNEEFAISVGLPNVIAHGMLTMALVGKYVTDWAGGAAAVKEYSARFVKPVIVPADQKVDLTVTATVAEVNGNEVSLTLSATSAGVKVLGMAKAVVVK